MNKAELINRIRDFGVKGADAVATEILDTIGAALRNGEKVELHKFGTFDVVDTPARKGRNPRTGEDITIPAGKRIRFRASKSLLLGDAT